MRKDITKKGINKDIEKADRDKIEVLEPAQKMSPFISFHYSYREITSINGRTHVRSKEKRFADGKLESKSSRAPWAGMSTTGWYRTCRGNSSTRWRHS